MLSFLFKKRLMKFKCTLTRCELFNEKGNGCWVSSNSASHYWVIGQNMLSTLERD